MNTWKEFAMTLDNDLRARGFLDGNFSVSCGDKCGDPRDRHVYIEIKIAGAIYTLCGMGSGYLRFYENDGIKEHLETLLNPVVFSYLLHMAKQSEHITLREIREYYERVN